MRCTSAEKREGPDDGVAAGGPGRPPRAIGAPLGQGSAQYRLVGVVEHAGGMAGGHYVAYVRGRGQGDAAWWRASDTSVRAIEENEVLRAQAYILFYECCG